MNFVCGSDDFTVIIINFHIRNCTEHSLVCIALPGLNGLIHFCIQINTALLLLSYARVFDVIFAKLKRKPNLRMMDQFILTI